jgi:ABC-type transport system substrate-binding protein
MRRVFAGLCVAAMFVAACSAGGSGAGTETTVRRTTSVPATTESTTTSSTTLPPTPQYGGVVVIGTDQEPPTLNPFVEDGDNAIVSLIGQADLAGVYDIDASTGELVPELVTQLPTVGNGGVVLNADGTMTVRYELRDDAVWSDGVSITGSDLEYTWQLMSDPSISGDQWAGLDVVDVAADGKTFSMTFASPTLDYETLFRYVVPRHAVEGSDFLNDWNTKMWPSAGPFVLAEWQPGEYIKMTRNENYWKTDPANGDRLPYLDGVEFRFIPDTEELIYEFTQRQIDVVQPAPSTDTVNRLKRLESAGVDLQVLAGPIWEHVSFQFGPENRNPDSMNQYRAFRQAVAYAIDPARIAAAVGWVPITSFLDPNRVDGPWSQYSYDPDRAKTLLAESCAMAERDCTADPPQVILTTTSDAEERPRVANYLAGALESVGIDVELQLEDSQQFFGDTLNGGTWDMGLFALVRNPGASGALSALGHFDPDSPPPDGMNYYRWGTAGSAVDDDSVARFRDVLSVARRSFDAGQVLTLSAAAEQILADNAVIIPIAARPVVGAVWADKVVGFVMNPTPAGHTWNIESWYRTDIG